MRNEFCNSLVSAADNPRFAFLTGDLGFKALEPLRDAAGARFINAGVAEQNMVSVAAGLARTGLQPWVYSIAPFVYARPYEQIRNDVCFHNLPVKLVGNGGGYGYGVMGSTHHALEDYGALLCLQNMHVFVPAFSADVPAIVDKLLDFLYPAYFRLGASEEPKDMELPAYAPWRKLLSGDGPTMLVVGPLVGPILAAARDLDVAHRPDLWVLTELPLHDIPAEFLADLKREMKVKRNESAIQAFKARLVSSASIDRTKLSDTTAIPPPTRSRTAGTARPPGRRRCDRAGNRAPGRSPGRRRGTRCSG